MSKKAGTNAATDSVNAEVVTSGVADARLEAVFQKLAIEDQKEVLEIADIEDRKQALELMSSLVSSAVDSTVTFKDAKPEQENITILIAGGLGLRAGTKLRAYLLGTVHIFSKEVKENWKEFQGATTKFYYNSYYKFRDINGKEFGIWSSPTLRILEKLPTHEATPSLMKVDPMVELAYHGIVEGKERLKQEFGLEIKKGDKAHIFIVRVAEGIQYNAYVKGCVNSLNSPVPMENGGGSMISSEEATRMNYEKLQQLQNQGSVAGLLQQ